MEWAEIPLSLLWRNAWAVIPLAVLVALVCRTVPCRPATRHALWVLVLLWFIVPLGLPSLGPQEVADPPRAADAASAIRASAGALDTTDAPDSAGSAAPLLTSEPVWMPVREPGVESQLSAPAACDVQGPSVSSAAAGALEIADALPRFFISAGAAPGTRAAGDPSPQAHAPGSNLHPEPRASTTLPPTARSGGMIDREAVAWESGPIRLAVPLRERDSHETPTELGSPCDLLPPPRSADGRVIGSVVAAPAPEDGSDSQSTELARLELLASLAPVPEADPAPPRAEAPAAAFLGVNLAPESWWRGWVLGMVQIRDRLACLPVIPAWVWLAGGVLVLLVSAARIAWFGRVIAKARIAPREIRSEVQRIARRAGLVRAPTTLLTSARVSPMVWCVGRPRLILPLPLWSTLDRVGRRAILCHELAHIRRGDTWLCWLEIGISALFWWHPLVWWVRRRIHEEADLCCDAWVTWLLPRGRRAYAEALLQASRFTCDAGSSPAAAVGVTSAGAKGIARRLTMVMTQSVRPRASWTGLALAGVVALAGWTALPAWSAPGGDAPPAVVVLPTPQPCPPGQATTPSAIVAPVVMLDPVTAGDTVQVPVLALPADEGYRLDLVPSISGSHLGTAVLASAMQNPPHDDLEERLSRLERELAALAAELRERHTSPIAGGGTGRGVWVVPNPAPQAPQPPQPPQPARGRRAPRAPEAPRAGVFMEPDGGMTLRAPSITIAVPDDDEGDEGQVVVRSYRLAEGKLDALYELMVRSDVPIPVGKGEGSIEVHATPPQHRTIEAFIRLIDPHGKPGEPSGRANPPGTIRSYILGDAEAPLADAARFFGSAGEYATAEALAGARPQLAALRAAVAELRAQSNSLREQGEDLRSRARGSGEDASQPLERYIRQLERTAQRLERQAESLEQQAEELRERSGRSHEDAEPSDDDDDDEDARSRLDTLPAAVLAMTTGVTAASGAAENSANLVAMLAAAGAASNTAYLADLLSDPAALAGFFAAKKAVRTTRGDNDNSADDDDGFDDVDAPEWLEQPSPSTRF